MTQPAAPQFHFTAPHPSVRAVIFDLDDTLAATQHMEDCRRGQRALLPGLLRDPRTQVHAHLRDVLAQLAGHVPLAVVTVSPHWYAQEVLRTLFPNVHWNEVITYRDVERHKPFPDAFTLAAQRLGVPAEEVIVVGDSHADIEGAYHAGMRSLMACWHHPPQHARTPLLPDSFLESPAELLYYVSDPSYCLPMLESQLFQDDPGYLPHNELYTCHTNVPRQPALPVTVLGRYFPRVEQTLPWHDRHPLSQQVVLKENPPFHAPDSWITSLQAVIARSDADIITVIPSKPDRDPRLERLLQRVAVPGVTQYVPDLLRFDANTPDIRQLAAADRYPTVLAHLHAHPHCAGRRVLVIDDVLTQGATLQAATALLMQAGAACVERVAIAKTISTVHFEVNPDPRDCPTCGAPLRRQRNGQTGEYFYGCSTWRRGGGGCNFTERA